MNGPYRCLLFGVFTRESFISKMGVTVVTFSEILVTKVRWTRVESVCLCLPKMSKSKNPGLLSVKLLPFYFFVPVTYKFFLKTKYPKFFPKIVVRPFVFGIMLCLP